MKGDLWIYDPNRGFVCCASKRIEVCRRPAPYIELVSRRGSEHVFNATAIALCRNHYGKRNAPARRKSKR